LQFFEVMGWEWGLNEERKWWEKGAGRNKELTKNW
jgi:hypothetical protein